MTKKTFSSGQTKELGEKLARRILRSKPGRRAKVLGLAGDLGSGKTTFAQGFARGLGIKRVMSPTFILIRRSPIPRHKFYRNFFHLDAYRLKRPEEFLKLGLREILADPRNILLAEWADRLGGILPARSARIKFSYGRKPAERIVKLNIKDQKLKI